MRRFDYFVAFGRLAAIGVCVVAWAALWFFFGRPK